jgi:hypothetical protein
MQRKRSEQLTLTAAPVLVPISRAPLPAKLYNYNGLLFELFEGGTPDRLPHLNGSFQPLPTVQQLDTKERKA